MRKTEQAQKRRPLVAIVIAVGLFATTMASLTLMSPTAVRADSKPVTPTITHADVNSTLVKVIWQKAQAIEYVKVYRKRANESFRYMRTVHGGTVFNDYGGRAGDTYYVVGFDSDDRPSNDSRAKVATKPGANGLVWLKGTSSKEDQGYRIRWSHGITDDHAWYQIYVVRKNSQGQSTMSPIARSVSRSYLVHNTDPSRDRYMVFAYVDQTLVGRSGYISLRN